MKSASLARSHDALARNDAPCLEILRPIGSGGAATVYLARLGGKVVALKQLHAFLADDPACVAALEDEIRLGASVLHPNVVRTLGVVDGIGGAPAVVMEWVEGVDLAKLLRSAARARTLLPLDVVAAIVIDALDGLHAAHECRGESGEPLELVHRDVSPHNLLVGFDGVVRITDFGVAKAAFRLQSTEEGVIKGKLGYLAPEQLTGVCGRRTDIFAVGAVLWELVTGSPMRSGAAPEMIVQILHGPSGRPSAVRPEAACLDAIIARALATFADERFATAAEMAAAITAAVTPASPARVAEIVAEVLASDTESTTLPIAITETSSTRTPAPPTSGTRLRTRR
ncbi:MAG: serine/threonine protein kinase [Deltaproteobacteria bacterium]|nr:serine/threonine protein kinase [Deltaproteobacteria bacterium]